MHKAVVSGMFLAVISLLLLALPACKGASPTPTPTLAPTLTPTPTPALPVGMKLGERYHDIHAVRLALSCTFCHSPQGDTYRDPLAQTFNPVDKRACLSCHKEGGAQPFYGEDWEKANVTVTR